MAWRLLQHSAALLLFFLCTCCIVWTSHAQPTRSSTAAARATIPCNGAISKTVVQQFNQALAAKLPAGRLTPPLGPSATTIQVSSWAELTQAVQQAKQSSTSTGCAVFKLLSDVTATNAVQLLPGMAVLGSSAAGAGGKAAIQCREGTPSAFVVNMTAGDSRDVVLSNLHVNSCSNSAIVANGTYKARTPLGNPPPGLVVTHSTFSNNTAAKEGGAILASQVAIYVYNSEFSGNSAAKFGGAIRISSGLLVAQDGMFRGNTAGLMSQSVGLDEGTGPAIFATKTAVAFFNTTVTGNAAEAVGGCAVAVTGSQPVLISGCHFTQNKCRPNRAQSNLQASSAASSSCSDGGGALRVWADGAAPDYEGPVDCKSSAGGQNAVVIMDSNFTKNEAAGDGVCGGSVMVQMAWLEVHSSSFSHTHGSHFGGALGALSSNVVITDSTFNNVSSTQIGGAIQNPAGRLWVFNSSFNDNYAKQSGGCIGSADGVAMQLHSVVFVQCSASVMGGAVWFELISVEPEEPPLFLAKNVRFLNCASGKEGGALGSNLVALEVADSEFIMCESYYGGAAVAYSAPMALINTRFINNTARSGGQGGALYTYDQPSANFTNCTWIGNKAYQGGVLMGGADPGGESEWLFEDCLLEGNAASQFGGALWGSGTNLTNVNTRYVSNTALAGGAVYATGFPDDSPLHVTFQDCILHNNSVAQSGGVAFLKTVARVKVQRSNVTQNSAKLVAGGLYLQDASGLIEDSNLAGNVAQSAGALMIEGEASSFLIHNSQLTQNKAGGSAGAAQLLKGSLTLANSTISNNYASSAAGGILLLSGSTLNCSMGCVFDGNNASIGAGITAESAAVHLTASNMSSNWAAGDLVTVATSTGQQDAACGGALWAESSDVIISGSTFEGNRANLQGGALYLLNSTATIKATKFSSNQAVDESLASALGATRGAATAGGGVYAIQAAAAKGGKRDFLAKDLLIYSCTFSGNAAGTGGAIAVAEKGSGVTDYVAAAEVGDNARRNLLQNKAGYKNNVQLPVLAANDLKKTRTLRKPTILFYSTLFVNNAASIGSGGSVFVDLVGASINISSSNFSSNSAAQGAGAIIALRPASLTVQASLFTFNAATSCGGLLLFQQQQPSIITGCSFTKNAASVSSSTHARGSSTANGSTTGDYLTADQTSDQRSFGQLPMYSSSGSGGGLCLVPGALVTISASIIRDNIALHGAGLFVQDGCNGIPTQQLHGGQPTANSSACQVTIANNTILGPNQLLPGGSGSAYYTSTASIVEVPDNLLVNLVGAGDGTSSNGSGTTEMVATSPYRLTGGLVAQQSNKSLLLDSGDSIGAVQLQLQDQLGSLVKSSVLQRLTFIAQAVPASPTSKSDTQLIGVTSTIVAPGDANTDPTGRLQVAEPSSGASPGSNAVPTLSSANATENLLIQFDNLELQGAPGETFNVVFSVKEAPEVTATIVQVELKPCTPGQAVMRGRDTTLFAGCTNCTNPLFSFDPTYPQCYTCPATSRYSKCTGDVITPADGFWQSHPRSTQLLACPFKPACTRSSSTYLSLTDTSLQWRNTALLTAAANRQNLSEIEVQQATLVGTYQHLQCADGYSGNLCGNCARDQRVSQATNRSCRPCQFNKVASAILFSAARLLDLAVVLLQVAIVLMDRQRRQTYADRDVTQISESVPDGSARQAQPGVTSHLLKEALVLQEQEAPANPHLVQIEPGTDSIFAMLIEYMQLLSVLRLTRFGEFWRTTAEAVLLALSITPISTYGWMSIECSLPAGLPMDSYAYYSTLATTLIPLGLTLVVCSIVVAKNAVQAKFRGFLTLRSYPHLVPECLLAASKAITYSYPIITGSIIGIFSCKTLDAPPTVAGEVVAAQGTYWTKDLDTVCFGRKHAAFMLALGLPMLLLILAYPAVQALLLARKARQQPGGLYEAKFWRNYSLLYEQYRPRMYLWGCLRDARQLVLIALVVVLQSQPDAQIQLVAGWMLALVLLALHAAVAPFKTRLLNALQLCMLASLAFTFYVGVISTVQGVPSAASSALQHIAVLLDVGVALLLLCVLLWRARLCFDYDNDGKVSWEDVKQTLRKHSIALCTGATSWLWWCLRRQDNRVAAGPLRA